MPPEPLKQIYLDELRSVIVDPNALARDRFRTALEVGQEVRCRVCQGAIRSLEDAYFLSLVHPRRGRLVAMACSDICLRRALAHGLP